MATWLAGAAINLVGSICINLGTNVMKLGHNKRASLSVPDNEKPPIRKFREWQIGVAVFAVGNIANFLSFGYAAQSLLAALGSVQFVSNVIFASFVLKEKITPLILIATACIVGGCIMLVIFGSHSSEEFNAEQLEHLYGQTPYIVYLSLAAAGVVGFYLLYLHGRKMVKEHGLHSRWQLSLPVSYATFGGLIGTQSVLFSKSMSVLLRETISGDNQLGSWFLWFSVFMFLVTAMFWVTRLNKGLTMFPAMIIVPVMQISWTLFSILSGLLYFQEYESYTKLGSIMFSLGVLTMFVGVFLLTTSASRKKQPEHVTAATDHEEKVREGANQDKLMYGMSNSSTAFNGDKKLSPELSFGDAFNTGDDKGLNGHPKDHEEGLPGTPRSQAGGINYAALFQQPLGNINEERSSPGSSKMMSVLRKQMHNIREDFGLEDSKGFARLALGLGDSSMPGISLFAMPNIDYSPKGSMDASNSSPQRTRDDDRTPTGSSLSMTTLRQTVDTGMKKLTAVAGQLKLPGTDRYKHLGDEDDEEQVVISVAESEDRRET